MERNIPIVQKPTLLKAMLPNTVISLELEEHFVAPRGDCGFITLGVSREVLSETVLSLKNNISDRQFLAEEIVNAFCTYVVTNGEEGLRPDNPDKWQELLQQRDEAQQSLDQLFRQTREGIADHKAKTLALDALIDWLHHKEKLSDAKTLTEQRLAVFRAETALETYCKQASIFEYYVKALGNTNLWLGYKSALLYAKLAKISLYIWKKEETNPCQLKLIHYHAEADSPQVIYMLHTAGFTHFTLLSAPVTPRSKPREQPLISPLHRFNAKIKPKHYEGDISGYQNLEVIYQGQNSTIYRGKEAKETEKQVPSVIIKVPVSAKKADHLRHEFEMCQQITSAYVVKCKELKPHKIYGYVLIEEDNQSKALTDYIPKLGFEPLVFLKIALQLAEGLYDIHRHNIIHRDIRPDNILIDAANMAVKYIDFGSASSFHQIKQVALGAHISAGTLAYISPEQTGRTNQLLDYRTDFYSLGVTFYQLICGQLPFTTKDTLELIHCHIAREAIAPHKIKSDIPVILSDLILKLLKKNVEDRYQSAYGLVEDLKHCLRELLEKGAIQPFTLAQQDIAECFYFPQKLYGREKELGLLVQALEHVSQGKAEVIMITGHAGTGKSMLVNELQSALKKGYFLIGKFEQLGRNLAYSAIHQAFQGWVKQLLSYEEEEILFWKRTLLEALGNQGQLIIDVIPELASILGEQPAVPMLEAEQTKNRFHLFFQNFIRAIAKPAHPLVLFLDDLQWADEASLKLIEAIATYPETQNWLLIGAYRDNEIHSSHPLLSTLKILQDAQIKVQAISLQDLDIQSVNRYLADIFHTSSSSISVSAKLIYRKTAGNPFFIKTFLQAIYEQGLLTLNKGIWRWELEKIEQLPAAENVIEFMSHQLTQLPTSVQDLLKFASCLGHRFTLATLEWVTKKSLAALSKDLQLLTKSGFLLQTPDYFQFVHDRVQEAAYALIPSEKRPDRHLSIGRLFQTKLPLEPTLEQLCEMMDHLNRGKSLISSQSERIELAQLNLQAGKKAKAAAAYACALNYLQAGESYLDATVWQEHYALAYDLYKALAEMEYLNGYFDAAENHMNLVLHHAKTILEKIDIYNLRIVQKTVIADYPEALVAGYQALKLLGIDLQAQDLQQLSQIESNRIKKNSKNKTIQELFAAQLMTSTYVKAKMNLLNNLIAPSYIGDPSLHELISKMLVTLTLQYGNTEESAYGYVSYGVILISRLNDIQLGYDFGLLGIQLSDKFHDLIGQCRTSLVYGMEIHLWRKPLREAIIYFDQGQQAGLEAGDFQYLGYLLHAKATCFFYQGMSLTAIEPELNKFLRLPYMRFNQLAIGIIRTLQLVILNLKGQTPGKIVFQDEIKNETDYQSNWQQEKNFYVLAHYLIFKTQALYLHEQFAEALEVLISAKPYLDFIPGNMAIAVNNFYHSLVLAALYPTVNNAIQQQYWHQLEANQQHMKIWADNCPENFLDKYLLVAAEMTRLQGKGEEAIEHYEQAIRLAQKEGFTQEHALACELAAKFWLAKNKPLCAQGYLYQAYNSYTQWGAKRKIDMLNYHYSDLLKSAFASHLSSFAISSDSTISVDSLALIDLSSVLKACQTISREINLTKLLVQIMQLLVGNAGAQTGTFWLEETGTLLLQAEYTAEGEIYTLQRLPLSHWKGARALVEYVKRTQSTLLLGDASQDKQFGQDLYIAQQKVKSVLCMPILRQNQLKAILYLENNLAAYAFTSHHSEVLSILASQIAIALENAIFYESMRSITERLNLALKAGNIGTWSWIVKDDRLTWDDAMYSLFGVKKEEFTHMRESFIALIHPDDRASVEQAIQQTLEKNIPYDLEYRIIKPDDKSVRVVLEQGKAYQDEKGQVESIIGVAWDITQRKQLETERFQALEQVKEKEHQRAQEAVKYQKEQEEFVDTVCHEIRNPMSGIFGNVDFMKQAITSLKSLKDTLPPANVSTLEASLSSLEESVHIIEHCAKHQTAIINGVLTSSKLETGKLTLALEPFRPKTVIEDTAKLFTRELATKSIKLALLLPAESLVVKSDPDRFKVILINLIANAIKFTEKGCVTISLQAQAVSSTHVALTLSVKDTGIGLTPEEQSRLFQRFSRAASSQYEGTGLGLSIVKKSIESMGGDIQVKSQKGQGTEFTVHITCETAGLEKAMSPVHDKSQPAQPNFIPKHILVVEDNAINQKMLCRQLQQIGHTCIIANNGREAIEKWAQSQTQTPTQKPFDLILMDLEMPVMGGLEATQKIREQEKQRGATHIPIVGVSANARDEYIQTARNAGMNDYITKPYKKEDIYHVIQQLTQTLQEKPAFESPVSPSELTAKTSLAPLITRPVMPASESKQHTQPSPFWSSASKAVSAKRVWMAVLLRNALYPILDQLSAELHTLGVEILMPEAKFKDKSSKTGWQLFSIANQDEHWAVLNLTQEADVDKMVAIICQSKAELSAKKMMSGSCYALVISFSSQITLSTEIDKVKSSFPSAVVSANPNFILHN